MYLDLLIYFFLLSRSLLASKPCFNYSMLLLTEFVTGQAPMDTEILDQLFDGYDSRVRPKVGRSTVDCVYC